MQESWSLIYYLLQPPQYFLLPTRYRATAFVCVQVTDHKYQVSGTLMFNCFHLILSLNIIIL